MPTTDGIETREENRQNRLAEFHIAEYSALTSRITYYVTLQYATWAIAAALLGYLAPAWSTTSNHRNLEWVGLLGVLAVSWAVLHINYEMLVIVRYLKEVLLPRMGTDYSVTLDEALGFEGWIRKLGRVEDFHRTQAPNILFGIGFVVLLVLLSRDIIHTHWAESDTWWALVSGPLLVIVCMKIQRLSVLIGQLQN